MRHPEVRPRRWRTCRSAAWLIRWRKPRQPTPRCVQRSMSAGAGRSKSGVAGRVRGSFIERGIDSEFELRKLRKSAVRRPRSRSCWLLDLSLPDLGRRMSDCSAFRQSRGVGVDVARSVARPITAVCRERRRVGRRQGLQADHADRAHGAFSRQAASIHRASSKGSPISGKQ